MCDTKHTRLTTNCNINLLLAMLRKELFQSLESSADILLGNLRQSVDLTEGSGNTALAAGNEDAARNDSFWRLALECLGIIDEFEEVLCGIGDVLGYVNSITVSADLLVRGK
jgi:hypothetical protein